MEINETIWLGGDLALDVTHIHGITSVRVRGEAASHVLGKLCGPHVIRLRANGVEVTELRVKDPGATIARRSLELAKELQRLSAIGCPIEVQAVPAEVW